MTTPAIEATGLTKKYRGTIAVDNLDLRVDQGATLGILGANGAGKTTTVEMIAGLRKPSAGTVRVMGLDPDKDRAKVRQVLGVQLQEAELHSALTASELVHLYRSFYPDPRPAQEVLDMVGLADEAGTRFENLSGGQQQRLSVALALVGRPRVVILDELSTGLDPRARRRVWKAIEQMRSDGVTVVLISHAMDEVERLCDEVLLLDAGKVLATGSPAQVVAQAGTANLEEAFVALTGHDVEEMEESA